MHKITIFERDQDIVGYYKSIYRRARYVARVLSRAVGSVAIAASNVIILFLSK